MIVGNFINSVFAEIIAGIFIAFIALLLFDIEKLKYRLARIFGINIYKTFERISSRRQVISIFNQLFVSYKVKNGGRILLMSNTGGYPEFDPYTRLAELSAYSNLIIYIAVTQVTFQQYAQDKPEVVKALLKSPNIELYLFDNLIPYKFRIGVNTDIRFGFYCAYYGHKENKVILEGIQSTNPIIIEGIESMYIGLLRFGKKLTNINCKELIGMTL